MVDDKKCIEGLAKIHVNNKPYLGLWIGGNDVIRKASKNSFYLNKRRFQEFLRILERLLKLRLDRGIGTNKDGLFIIVLIAFRGPLDNKDLRKDILDANKRIKQKILYFRNMGLETCYIDPHHICIKEFYGIDKVHFNEKVKPHFLDTILTQTYSFIKNIKFD